MLKHPPMAADLDSSARVGSVLFPSLQDAKSQATRIYGALDAKGYGIIKRQQLAEALPDNKVRVQERISSIRVASHCIR